MDIVKMMTGNEKWSLERMKCFHKKTFSIERDI